MNKIKQYFQNQINEIKDDWILRVFGIMAASTMFYTYKLWMGNNIARLISKDSLMPICWPFLPNCESFHVFTVTQIEMYLQALVGITILTMILFLFKKTVKYAWWAFLLIHLMKYSVLIQSYQLMGNYHFMEFLSAFTFLFIPAKIHSIRIMLVAFYVSAGTIKFNEEWLSGAAIPDFWLKAGTIPYWVKQNGLIPLSSAYAVLLEMVIVLGMLSKKQFWFWFSFLQIVAFHIFSWFIVGFFYPSVMLSLLVIFPLYMISGRSDKPNTPVQYFKALPALARVFILAFILTQLIPKIIPGDSALTGEGRLYSLNMFDAKSDCYNQAIAHMDGWKMDVSTSKGAFGQGVRIWCDPYNYFFRAKSWCKVMKDWDGFQRISLHMVSKASVHTTYSPRVILDNVCDEHITYSTFQSNDWIKK